MAMAIYFDVQLARLLEKEKVARVNNEHFTSVTILKDIITLCFNTKNWDKLYEQINFLMNRRGQGKKAQIEMIQLAMTWLSGMGEPERTKLIETIRDACAKKIFLYVYYARCVLMIVKSKENDNEIMYAASILQYVQVETYGSMDKREKLYFILYQMKIMLKKKDFVRLFIISKKINEQNINDDDIADIKICYFAYMAIYYNKQQNFKEICRCYRIIWETLQSTKKIIPEIIDFGFLAAQNEVLANYVAFLVLQSYSPYTEKYLKTLSERYDLYKIPYITHLINNFLSEYLVSCDIYTYTPEFFELFRVSYYNHDAHRKYLKRMLVQHNIRVISKYYGCLKLYRLGTLITVDKDYCEEYICSLNNKKLISCRVDRIANTIDFRAIENYTFLLETWNEEINTILSLVDVASNLIHREREVYKK